MTLSVHDGRHYEYNRKVHIWKEAEVAVAIAFL